MRSLKTTLCGVARNNSMGVGRCNNLRSFRLYHSYKTGALRATITSMLIVVACGLLPGSTYALDYGQIKGVVTDVKTKEPIVGATVQILGVKNMGAVTDANGRYNIRLVPPGLYDLQFTSVGYEKRVAKGVRVYSELTQETNMVLSDQASKLEGIVITAEKVIDKYEVSSMTKITNETIDARPVKSVDDLLNTVSGVVKSDQGEVHIRGGRAGEIAYIVDGVNIRDPVGGPGPVIGGIDLVAGSAAEIQVIKDGFDPEYGNALSGVIKITSQTGPANRTILNARFITDDFGTAKLNTYSRNFDNYRFTLAGPDPFITTKILPSLGVNFLKDKELTYFFYAEMEKSDGTYDPFNYVPGFGNRSFDKTSVLGVSLPERLNNTYNLNTNISLKPRSNMKFILSYQSTGSKSPFFSSSSDWLYRFTPGTAPMNQRDWKLGSLKLTHSLNENTNYEVIVSYKHNKITNGPTDPNHPGLIMQPDQFLQQDLWETFTDADGNGVYTPPEEVINTVPDTVSYGQGLSGPRQNFGENVVFTDVQTGNPWGNPISRNVITPSDFQFNLNGVVDGLEGETYNDRNGNGVWDAGDPFKDTNGNGVFDPSRRDNIAEDNAEPFQDGDQSLGEPFTDVNGNGFFDPGIDIFLITLGPENQDLNRNSIYDGPDPDSWSEGIPFVDLNGNGVFDRPNGVYDPGETFVDLNHDGRFNGRDQFLDPGSYDTDARWTEHTVNTIGAEVKVNRTFARHDLKAGFEIHQDDFNFKDIRRPYQPYTGRPDGGTFPTIGSARDFFDYKPTQGSMYFRDKLEYGSMIASLGFRWDFFVQSDGLLQVALNDDLNSGVIVGDRQKFSPRIGFSYPISDKAKVFFNYGHFYQLPTFDLLFARNTSSADRNDVIGNYNLDFEKTIQYSFGVQYALSDAYSVTVGGYYKDEFDKVGQGDVRLGATRVRQFQNNQYARSRGFELTLNKRRGIVTGEVNYTYAFAFGKDSQTNKNFLDDFAISRQPLGEKALSFDVRHQIKTAVQLVVPKNSDASLFGIPILDDWTMSVEGTFESGRPFTPTRDFPNLLIPLGSEPESNSLRRPSRLIFNTRVEKNFRIAGIDYSAILWVENIFNTRYPRTVFGATGLPNADVTTQGIIQGGSEFANNPLNFAAEREVRVGLQMSL